MPSPASADIPHLRAALAAARAQGGAYPPALRARALALVEALAAEGRSTWWAANALGLAVTTLVAWRRTTPVPSPFLPVVVRDVTPVSTLCLVLPGGARVEGLSLDQVAVLCRQVGS